LGQLHVDLQHSDHDLDHHGPGIKRKESDDYVRRERPCLYRTCKCDEYGGPNCLLKFQENCEGARQ